MDKVVQGCFGYGTVAARYQWPRSGEFRQTAVADFPPDLYLVGKLRGKRKHTLFGALSCHFDLKRRYAHIGIGQCDEFRLAQSQRVEEIEHKVSSGIAVAFGRCSPVVEKIFHFVGFNEVGEGSRHFGERHLCRRVVGANSSLHGPAQKCPQTLRFAPQTHRRVACIRERGNPGADHLRVGKRRIQIVGTDKCGELVQVAPVGFCREAASVQFQAHISQEFFNHRSAAVRYIELGLYKEYKVAYVHVKADMGVKSISTYYALK